MIEIKNNCGDVLYKQDSENFFLFPGGEVGVKLNPHHYKFFGVGTSTNKPTKFIITARIHNSNDLIALAMVKDSLERIASNIEGGCGKLPIELILPYLPYARQDRVCVKGEAFSLKVLGNFINSLNFDKVVILDPHSPVAEAVIDNVKVVTQLDIIFAFKPFRERVFNNECVFVSPDAGSNKKVSVLAQCFGHREFIRADKLRDLETGKIKETIVYADDLNGCDVVIADDICDGGRTFIELAKVLKNKNAGKIILYVTHGIFSQGFKVLFDGGIDEIYTTDSFSANFLGILPEPPRLNILKVENLIK